MQHAPGYYTTNYRALRLRELARMFGLLRLPFTYFRTRFMRPSNPGWMPGLWADNECKQADLSERFWQATQVYRQDFLRLGFEECGFSRITRSLNTAVQDNGGISYLDEGRCCFGLLVYTRVRAPFPSNAVRETILVVFTVVFQRGSLSSTNNKRNFDPLPHQKVVRLPVARPEQLYRRLLQDVSRHPEPPRRFPDLESLKSWFDQTQMEVFQERAQRKLFLRMSDEEVEAARRKFPHSLRMG